MHTYALGSGVNSNARTILTRLGSDHRGEFKQVSDGGDLVGSMTDYYKSYALNMDLAQVRWLRYNDWASQQPLVSACVAIADTTTVANDYIGVVCMDVNVVVTLQNLQV